LETEIRAARLVFGFIIWWDVMHFEDTLLVKEFVVKLDVFGVKVSIIQLEIID
jgi:hypothetical protein